MYTVEEAKAELKTSIQAYLLKDEEGDYLLPEVNCLPFYLQGAPGIGKTQLVEQTARELSLGFVALSITHHTRNTMLGLPVIHTVETGRGEEKYTSYTMSEMIALVEKEVEQGHSEGILLIDEFACMAESMVAPMLAFLQTKNIGTHVLPRGWVMVLCSNPPKYNKTARIFDMAVMDRVRVMDITFSAEEFIAYGEKKGFHPLILEYLRNHKSNAHVCEQKEDGTRVIVTTRGWENLSHCIKAYEKMKRQISYGLVKQFIKSEQIAGNFFKYYTTCTSGLREGQAEEILAGINLPRHIDAIEALSYIQRWNIMNLLKDALTERCSGFPARTEALLRMQDTVMELREKRAETNSEKQYKHDYLHLKKRCQGAEDDDEAYLEVWKNKNLEPIEKDMLKTILERCDAEKGVCVKTQGSREYDFELLLKLLDETLDEGLQEYRSRLQKAEEEVNSLISNAILFVEGIAGEDNLAEPFVNSLQQDIGVLDVLINCHNREYLEVSKRAFGSYASA